MKLKPGALVEVYSLKKENHQLSGLFVIKSIEVHKDKLQLYTCCKYCVIDIYSGVRINDINVWKHNNGLEYYLVPKEYTCWTYILASYHYIFS